MHERISRWYLPAIAALTVLLVGLLAMVAVDRAMRASAIAEAMAAADGDAAILAAGLESELDKFTLVPRVLAVDPEVRALLSADQRQLALLNTRLADLAEQTGAAAIYLMDANGLTLAASNWQLSTSFIGSNYGFRSYFSDAVANGASSEFALGTVSRRPGLYIAQSVQSGDTLLGVVAVKVEFHAIEKSWREAEEGAFVTDAEGIVLITSNPDWRFHTTRGSDPGTRIAAEDQLRFGVSSPEPMPNLGTGSSLSITPLIEKIQPISADGWELHLLVDPAPRVVAAIANGRLYVLLGLILAAGAGGLFIIWLRRREMHAEAILAAGTAMMRDQLQQANRLATLGQVTAGVGHEIRQPVAAMRVFAENGEKLIASGQNAAAAENFEKIITLTARIGQITEALLSFGRRAVHPPKEMPLAQVINGALMLLRDRIEREEVKLIQRNPELSHTLVRGEHVRLEQVLINLLQNALDVSRRGEKIAIQIEVDEKMCRLSVVDNGPGIDQSIEATLFQPFATTKDAGLGLGLAISLDIMRSLGGDLLSESSSSGARFTMVIPRA